MHNTIRIPIEGDMARFESARRQLMTSGNPLLQLALTHVASRQGKMMRPMLTFLMARRDSTHADSTRILNAALALELLHTASLVHDDVVDESDRRRGIKSVNALIGNQAAVLVGDYILSLALAASARTAQPSFVEAIATLGQDLADGELLQLHSMDCTDFSEERYFNVIRRKTASLFATCAAASDYLRGSDPQQAYRLGELIGDIFQIRDDIFDLNRDTDTGKPAGNDLREGKITLPVIHAIQLDPSLTPAALRARRHEATPDDITLLTNAACHHGIDYATQLMQSMTGEAHDMAHNLIKDPDIAQAIHTYIDYVAKRET